ncbi:hypothetical protein EIL87_07605 [Saccharopolyspora rhizosphaerae]|uniref:Uncharacterized protein n=1 Tax=Saccharopolyspora rhizosphaerae TaxID=2492662 RepID=A0A426JYB7_9PSEU|nr:hypothetical protein [Saccharopolyspora rhizosphaerae]RRO18112.1 hypothetical protein EIL87_07605 [Saccharopolyspora rhizosphaerae]
MAAEKHTEQSTAPTPKALSAAKAFVADHGGSARAVVENIGRAGARVVLIGEDGRLGDVVVSSHAVGEALVEAVEGLSLCEWDADTTAALKIGAAHRRAMAGPRAR